MLTRKLQAAGKRVGLITNDQGTGLVDSLVSLQFSDFSFQSGAVEVGGGGGKKVGPVVREISGGCFCCKADELAAALRGMQEGEDKPDVFIAEPVGSCTDLVATVLLPLERTYGQAFQRAPMSVVMDAQRAWNLWCAELHSASSREEGADENEAGAMERSATPRSFGKGFSKDVTYIFLKQLEEAEILVVNKVDLLKPKQLEQLLARLNRDWEGKRIITISAKTGAGCDAWMELLMGQETQPQQLMEVDYERYAVGEALMGWFNATVELTFARGTDGNAWLLKLARGMQASLEAEGVELAHFKMSLEPRSAELKSAASRKGAGEEARPMKRSATPRSLLVVVNTVRNGTLAEVSREAEGKFKHARMLINLRAEGEPAVLDAVVMRHLHALTKGVVWELTEKAAFKPGKPQPTHRVTKL